MRERAAFKSSVRIIRGAHLLRGYRSDNLSEARRCTTTEYKDEIGGEGEGHAWRGTFGKAEGIVILCRVANPRDGPLILPILKTARPVVWTSKSRI